MNKEEIYRFLTEKEIPYEITEHPAIYNVAEAMEISVPYPEAAAKNLFLRDDKKKNYYLITLEAEKKIQLKDFRKQNATRPLSFASEEELWTRLRLQPGAVTPFGLLNDEEKSVQFYLDDYFIHECPRIGCHPNDNTATVWLKSSDLLKLIEEHGNSVHVVMIDSK